MDKDKINKWAAETLMGWHITETRPGDYAWQNGDEIVEYFNPCDNIEQAMPLLEKFLLGKDCHATMNIYPAGGARCLIYKTATDALIGKSKREPELSSAIMTALYEAAKGSTND